MKPRDLAERFLAKAAQDEALIDRVIDDAGIADESIGFHFICTARQKGIASPDFAVA